MTLIPETASAEEMDQSCVVCCRYTGEHHIADHDHCDMCAASLAKDSNGITVAECIWCSFVNSPNS